MPWRPALVSVLALTLLGGVAAEPVALSPVGVESAWVEPEREPWHRPPEASLGDLLWNDQVIGTQIAWACDAVEAVSGRTYRRRPCWARPGTVPWRGNEESLWGQFDGESWTVTLNLPVLLKEAREGCPLSACHVRLVLVHEVVHALDAEAHPDLFDGWKWRKGASACWVGEGHAQFVTARIAAASGQWTAFRELVAMMVSVPCGGDPFEAEEIQAASWDCRYSWGRLFMEDAHRWGGRQLIESLLDRPPDELPTREDHDWWLSRRKRDMEGLARR